MHQSTPPDWSGWHHQPPPHPVNGHDLQLGQMLGQLLAQNDRQTRVLERISDRLDDLPEDIAVAMPRRDTQQSDRLSSKEKVQIALAAGIVVLALAGKVSIHEAIQLLAKPIGGM